jgi:archaellum biogenesis ATPase FlaH
MSFIEEYIKNSKNLSKKDRRIIIDMFKNVLINEDVVELRDIFDKMIEEESTSSDNDG